MNINDFNNTNTNEDHLIPVLIDDTVQCLRFFPSKNVDFLASGSWDSKLNIFEINYRVISQNSNQDIVKIASEQKNSFKHQSPILSLSWKGTSGVLFSGCIDGTINYIDCQKNNVAKIGEHRAGCREVIYIDNYDALLTGGWDGALKVWDLRSKDPILTYQFCNKIYSMSSKKNLLVVSLSENVMSYFNLDNLQKYKFEPELIYLSHIKNHIKKVAVTNEGNQYLEGSSEGRIAVKNISFYLKPKFSDDNCTLCCEKDFAFRCHREVRNIGNNNFVQCYPVNDICVNPVYGSVASAGGNGKYCIWDIVQKSKVFERPNSDDKTPLTACEFNNSGNLLAYASGYDWSKGAQYAHLYNRPKIFIHYLQPNQRKSSNKY